MNFGVPNQIAAPVPSANGGSVQRSGSAPQSSSLKNLLSLALGKHRRTSAPALPGSEQWECTHKTRNTRKESASIRVHLRLKNPFINSPCAPRRTVFIDHNPQA